MELGNNKELAKNKLILLYIIAKVDMPISNNQIMQITLEKKYMNYFQFQELMNELSDNGFIKKDVLDDKTQYTLTESGKNAVEYFKTLIPPGIKLSIDKDFQGFKQKIKNETFIEADFSQDNQNGFIVSLNVREGEFSLIDLKLAVGTRNDARIITDNWKNHSSEIYSEIIALLSKERK